MRKSIKYLVITLANVLLFTVGCKSQTPELNKDYLIGKWINHYSTMTEDGITTVDPISTGKKIYRFNKNGTVDTDLEGKLIWSLSENGELLLSEDGQTATYSTEIESDSSLVVSRAFRGRIFSYFFKKQKDDSFEVKVNDSIKTKKPRPNSERNYDAQEIGRRILYTGVVVYEKILTFLQLPMVFISRSYLNQKSNMNFRSYLIGS